MSGAPPKKRKGGLAKLLRGKKKGTKASVSLTDLSAEPAAPSASSRPIVSAMAPVSEQEAPGLRVGVLERQSSEASAQEMMEREAARRTLAEVRRRHAVAAATPAPEEPAPASRMPVGPGRLRGAAPWRPTRGPAAAAAPVEVVSLAQAMGTGAPPKVKRAAAAGAWGAAAVAAPEVAAPAAVVVALGEGAEAIPTDSSLCSGPELSADDLRSAVRDIVSDLRDDLKPETRAEEVVRLRPADGPEARVAAAAAALTDCGEWDSRPAAHVGPFLVALLEQRAFTAAALRACLADEVYPLLSDLALDAPNLWKVVAAALRPLADRRTLRVETADAPDVAPMPAKLRRAMDLDDAAFERREAEAKAKAGADAAAAAAAGPEEEEEEAETAAAEAPAAPAPAPVAAPAPAPPRASAPAASGYIPPHLRAAMGGYGAIKKPSRAEPAPAPAPAAADSSLESDGIAALLAAGGKKKKKAKKAAAAAAAPPAAAEADVAALLAAGGKKKKKKAKKADA